MGPLLLFAILAVCYGQAPMPCDSPKQWEGRRILVDRSKHYTDQAKIYYDETNMRMREEDIIEQGKEREFVSTLRLFNTKKEYRVNLMTKKCNVTTIDYPFRPIGVPKDAKFLFEAEVGLASVANEHFTIVTYYGNYTEDHVRYSTSVTYPNCVPIGDNYFNDVTGYIENRYADIHPAIKNMTVFDIPAECKSL